MAYTVLSGTIVSLFDTKIYLYQLLIIQVALS
jgi:hypothetical protein